MLFALTLLAFQTQTQPAIAKLVIQPGLKVTVPAQDTMRLIATAVDAEGKPVPGAIVRFFGQGGRFEGDVDSTGLVRSGSTGTITVTAVGRVPGGRPVSERIEVQMVAGPAARIEDRPRYGDARRRPADPARGHGLLQGGRPALRAIRLDLERAPDRLGPERRPAHGGRGGRSDHHRERSQRQRRDRDPAGAGGRDAGGDRGHHARR